MLKVAIELFFLVAAIGGFAVLWDSGRKAAAAARSLATLDRQSAGRIANGRPRAVSRRIVRVGPPKRLKLGAAA